MRQVVEVLSSFPPHLPSPFYGRIYVPPRDCESFFHHSVNVSAYCLSSFAHEGDALNSAVFMVRTVVGIFPYGGGRIVRSTADDTFLHRRDDADVKCNLAVDPGGVVDVGGTRL